MNAKKKGNAGENKFANWLTSRGLKAYRNASSGANTFKSDIHNAYGINFEVKTCKKINLQECWKQTDRDSSLSRTMPMLAIHFDGMPDNSWLMVMHSEDWLEMFQKSQDAPDKPAEPINQENRALKFEVEKFISQGKRVMKLLDT